MRISKPGSANHSPRSSTLQSRRRMLATGGSQGRPHQQSPVKDPTCLPTPGPESTSDMFYERDTRPARPVSWHPSSQLRTQQPLFFPHDGSNTMVYPYPAYPPSAAEASVKPPSPALYSGCASPGESSPLSLPYSSFRYQEPCSPPILPQQQQSPVFPLATSATYSPTDEASQIPYLPDPILSDSTAWEVYPQSNDLPRHTAPPTPEGFAYGGGLVSPKLPYDGSALSPQLPTETRQEQQHQGTRWDAADASRESYHQPLIRGDEDDEAEGEILYGLGLYDTPDHGKKALDCAELPRSSVLWLWGGAPPGVGAVRSRVDEEEPDTGKGLGLKLEEAWEPPASDDEAEGEDEEKEEADGQE